MTWEEIMRRVLPPVDGLSPHITSEFGATNRPKGSTNPHRAVDFNYYVGPNGQQGINLTHPAVHSPVAGVVTHVGGKYGTIAIRDVNGFSHEILHTNTRSVKVGDLVGVGAPIGTMGSTGASAEHVHYQLKDRAGKVINPTDFWNNLAPAKDDPGQPAFLEQSKHATETFSGLDEKSPLNGAAPPDRPDSPFFNPFSQPAPASVTTAPPPNLASPTPFIDRYLKFGSVPHPNAQAASDAPASFDDRFGSWASSPAGALGNVGAPAPQPAPNPGKRSELPTDVTSTSSQGTEDDAPVRILGRRVVNLSATSADTPFVPAGPATSTVNGPPPPLLGIFSGKPMRDYPVRPSIFATDDRSSPDDDELYQRWRRWLDA